VRLKDVGDWGSVCVVGVVWLVIWCVCCVLHGLFHCLCDMVAMSEQGPLSDGLRGQVCCLVCGLLACSCPQWMLCL
jgi:hypothetical protein